MQPRTLLDRRQLMLTGGTVLALSSLNALAHGESPVPKVRGVKLPFQPMRQALYRPEELLDGFAEQDALSYTASCDFNVYKHFVENGRHVSRDFHVTMMQALHDHSITQNVLGALEDCKCVAIMGGHRLRRDSETYHQTALLARSLSRAGFTVASGGGPGAMEAAHLGAILAGSADEKLKDALRQLASQAALPDTVKIISDAGKIDVDVVKRAHAWLLPAVKIFRSLPAKVRGDSIAVPTWLFGHEPPTPFASRVAKYFQNSIREEGLLGMAKHGIIYVRGSAGTVQEIFQDGCQNYYRTYDWFSPMVLFDVDYWTKTLPVVAVLRSLFKKQDFEKFVLVTDSVDDALAFINSFKPESPSANH
jgi:predicted Rossmann-fold nucleotide-binding protein